MPATRPRSGWVSPLLVCVAPSVALACRYTVRDVGFVDLGSPAYRLGLFVRDDTPEKLTAAFKQAAYAVLLDSNVDLEIVNVDRQKDHPAIKMLDDCGIRSFPAAVLASPRGPVLELSVAVSHKPLKQVAWSCLEAAVTSPKREEIREHLVKAYCVVLLMEGTDADENRRAERAATGAIDGIAGVMDQMPKPTREPPRLVRIARKQFSREKTLLWGLGLDADDLQGPYVAVLYGRGRWIGPLFEGPAITRAGLDDVLSLIGASCECGLAPEQMLGVMLPMRWDQDAQSQSVKVLGFDPENPMVKMEISRILSRGAFVEPGEGGLDGIGLLGYSEQVVEFSSDPEEASESLSRGEGLGDRVMNTTTSRPSGAGAPLKARPAESKPPPRPQASAPAREPRADTAQAGSNLRTIWSIVGGMVLLILAGGVFVILRAQRRSA